VPMRRFPRYEVDRPLNVVVFWEDVAVRTIRGRCHVLGEGGLAATISDQLYVGEVVGLDLYPVARTYGSVRSVRGPDHGFEFLFTNENQRRAIKRLCEACASDVN
jgi:PilZ domain